MPDEEIFFDEISFHYHANMVANETLSTLDTMDGYTEESKQLKTELQAKCLNIIKQSIEYFNLYYEGEGDSEEPE